MLASMAIFTGGALGTLIKLRCPHCREVQARARQSEQHVYVGAATTVLQRRRVGLSTSPRLAGVAHDAELRLQRHAELSRTLVEVIQNASQKRHEGEPHLEVVLEDIEQRLDVCAQRDKARLGNGVVAAR